MNRIVIYTSITGGYESLKQPVVIRDDIDYICFTNDIQDNRVGVWMIKPIPWSSNDLIRQSRYAKLNPHKVVPEYTYSVWMDSNLQILDELLYACIEKCIQEGQTIALPKHPLERKDMYEEAAFIYFFRREKLCPLTKQVLFLYNEGFPRRSGLFENNIIFRKHNEPTIKRVSNIWWETYMRFSRRDQLSFCYSAWKVGVTPTYLLPDGVKTTGNNPHIHRINHVKPRVNNIKAKLKETAGIKALLDNSANLRLQLRLAFPKFYFQHILRIVSLVVKIK